MKNKTLRTKQSFNNTYQTQNMTQYMTNKLPETQIELLSQKHYKQAMKYIYRKNKQQEQLTKRKATIQKIDRECTFSPILLKNKYQQKIEQSKQKTKTKKHIQLAKWGINHSSGRRQSIINKQVQIMSYSTQNIRNRSLLRNSRQRSTSPYTSIEERQTKKKHSLATNQAKTESIPGVRKFYLKQAKGLASKNNDILRYRGTQKLGFTFF